MRIFKKVLAFILLNVFAASMMEFFFAQPTVIGTLIHQLHTNDYSTIILGQSLSETGIDPLLLSEGSDEALNLGHSLMPVENFYYLLKEANRDGHVKRVFLEIDNFYWKHAGGKLDMGENRGREDVILLSHLTGVTKLEYLVKMMMDQNYNCLFDYQVTPITLNRVPGTVRAKKSKEYRDKMDESIGMSYRAIGARMPYEYGGRGYIRGVKSNGISYGSAIRFDADSVQGMNKSFNQVVEYCKRYDIELICFTTALPPYHLAIDDIEQSHEYFNELCASAGVPYYNLNYLKWEYLDRTDLDYVDGSGHMLGDLAERQTLILKDIAESDHPEMYFEQDFQNVLRSIPEHKDN